MTAPLVGRKVKIAGVTSKPELNGLQGIAVSFDDAKGRYSVRLDKGETISLKPSALEAVDAGGAGTGGFPGMGGMGGMGGMPGMMGGGLPAMLARLLAGGGGGLPSLPGGLQPQHLLMAAVGIFFMLPRLGIGVMPALLLGGAGVAVYSSAANGRGASGIMDGGRRLLGTVSSVLGRVTGRQISPMQAMFLLTAAAFLVYKFVLSSGSGDSFFSSPSPPNSQAGFAACALSAAQPSNGLNA